MRGVWWSVVPIMVAVWAGLMGGISLWGLWNAMRAGRFLSPAVPLAIVGLGVFGGYVWLGLQLRYRWLIVVACVSLIAGLFYDWGSRPPVVPRYAPWPLHGFESEP